mmetsp:Transcript_34389/g.73236  ORF Transcript_34389/g.73236 Transcript_34389/m.73236 type:complete len:209 (-) Transcript_34389:195-821(-)
MKTLQHCPQNLVSSLLLECAKDSKEAGEAVGSVSFSVSRDRSLGTRPMICRPFAAKEPLPPPPGPTFPGKSPPESDWDFSDLRDSGLECSEGKDPPEAQEELAMPKPSPMLMASGCSLSWCSWVACSLSPRASTERSTLPGRRQMLLTTQEAVALPAPPMASELERDLFAVLALAAGRTAAGALLLLATRRLLAFGWKSVSWLPIDSR